MTTTAAGLSFDTKHADMIHDAQLDYYGKRMATCSSDRTIKIFELIGDNDYKHTADIKGHEGPVWQISWAHPQFGSILASCSYDHKVFIWKEVQTNVWTKIYEHSHDSSVNSIAWAPHELGLILATASSDRTLAFLEYNEQADTFAVQVIKNAHDIGCNAVSWAPATSIGSLTDSDSGADAASKIERSLVKMVASGGGDNQVKIWKCLDNQWGREPIEKLDGHTDWVRDVQWAPNIGLPYDTIASCSQDRRVIIHTRDQQTGWKREVLVFNTVVWRVSWSITGSILAVSTADNQVTLWKNDMGGRGWIKVSSMEDEHAQQQQ